MLHIFCSPGISNRVGGQPGSPGSPGSPGRPGVGGAAPNLSRLQRGRPAPNPPSTPAPQPLSSSGPVTSRPVTQPPPVQPQQSRQRLTAPVDNGMISMGIISILTEFFTKQKKYPVVYEK